jgi:hypothetical protein
MFEDMVIGYEVLVFLVLKAGHDGQQAGDAWRLRI